MGKKYGSEFKSNLVDLYVSGSSTYQLSKEYSVRAKTINQWIRQSGGTIRNQRTELSATGEDKTCSKCGAAKPLTSFSPHREGTGGRRSWCKECVRIQSLERNFKLSPDGFSEMMKNQEGKCAICKIDIDGYYFPGSGISTRASVDHDHSCCSSQVTCGKCIRGLLCSKCNQGIGSFQDNEEILLNAVSYLRNHRSRAQQI